MKQSTHCTQKNSEQDNLWHAATMGYQRAKTEAERCEEQAMHQISRCKQPIYFKAVYIELKFGRGI